VITLNSYFDAVIWIGSREHRPDRADLLEAQLERYGIEATHFNAHWKPLDHLGNPSGNMGCTASHRGVLELICHNEWWRTLILEDDAMFVSDDWPDQFDAMIREVPDDWAFLFLGASYAEAPKRRVSGSVIQANGLMTTSSYGITYEMARLMAPHISGIGPIDSLYQGWQRAYPTYILDPRLCVQRPGYSDLQDRESDNSQSMLDRAHVDRLDGLPP
jgi:GR25 family glycosyltransferase involved in LPS biosynthesis